MRNLTRNRGVMFSTHDETRLCGGDGTPTTNHGIFVHQTCTAKGSIAWACPDESPGPIPRGWKLMQRISRCDGFPYYPPPRHDGAPRRDLFVMPMGCRRVVGPYFYSLETGAHNRFWPWVSRRPLQHPRWATGVSCLAASGIYVRVAREP